MDVKPKKKNKELSKDKTEVKEKKSKKSKIVKGVSAVKDATANDDDPKPKKSKKRARQDDEKCEKKTKKRKTTEEPAAELEIDITAPNPPSKKALRLQKKGKPVPPLPSTSQPPTTEPHPVDTTHPDRKKLVKEIVRADFGVWIGNMSYKSDVKALRDWLVRGEKRIADKEITRINVPLNADGQSKGFAYVDFLTKEAMEKVVSRSEEKLDGRNLLIKDANNFAGRPSEKKPRYQVMQSKTNTPKTPNPSE